MSYINKDINEADIIKDWNELALKKFSGFDLHPYESYLVTPFALIFITRPKLFIKTSPSTTNDVLENLAYRNMALHPYLSRFTRNNIQNKKDLLIADLLSYSDKTISSREINNLSFIPIITNKTRNFAVDANTLSTAEQGVTKHGYRHVYPTHNINSMSNGVLSIEFQEMADLEISNMMGIWYNTTMGSVNGELRANPNMIKENRLDYVSSLYYFKLDRDAKTIKYWAKYNGVFPINNPSEAFGWQASSTNMTSLNANFSFDSREELTFSILDDFNNTSLGIKDIDSSPSSNNFTLDMFSESAVLNKASGLVDQVPLIYYVEDNKSKTQQSDTSHPTDAVTKKRFILKLGSNSVYKSASEEMFGRVGHLGNRDKLYGQNNDE